MLNSSFPSVGIIKHRRFSGFRTDSIACLTLLVASFLVRHYVKRLFMLETGAQSCAGFQFKFIWITVIFAGDSVYMYICSRLWLWLFCVFLRGTVFFCNWCMVEPFFTPVLGLQPLKGLRTYVPLRENPERERAPRAPIAIKIRPSPKIHKFLKTFSYIFGIIDTKIPGTFYYILRLAVLSAG